MFQIKRSALFKRQLLTISQDYRDRADKATALKFIDGVEHGVNFILKNPFACVVYTRLQGKEFRKWGVTGFPVSIFFRVENENTLILEALYAHRMDITNRLPDDLK